MVSCVRNDQITLADLFSRYAGERVCVETPAGWWFLDADKKVFCGGTKAGVWKK